MAFLITTLAWIALALTPSAAAQSGPAPSPDRFAEQVDALAATALKSGPLAGISIGVARGDETLLEKGWGFAELENEVPATGHTVYRIASMTKQFTAALVLQLCEDGKLSLDAPLSQLAPEFDCGGRTIPLRRLLDHTSGIPSYTSVPDFDRRAESIHRTADVLALLHGRPFDFEPGSRFLYNNSAFFLAGEIAAHAAGLPYDRLVSERIFGPLGMSESCYGFERPLIPHRAQGYQVDGGKLVNDVVLDMVIPGGAGALCSTVHDLLKWPRALWRNEILGDESVAAMTTPTHLDDGVEIGYGFGLVVDRAFGTTVIAHGGNINGFNSWIEWYPERELTIVVLVNTEGSSAQELAARVAKLLFAAEPAPAESPAATPPADVATVTAGSYRDGTRVLTFAASATGAAGFTTQFLGQPAERLRFRGERDGVLEFTFESDSSWRVAIPRDRATPAAPASHIIVVHGIDVIRLERALTPPLRGSQR